MLKPRLKRKLKMLFLLTCAVGIIAGTGWLVHGVFTLVSEVVTEMTASADETPARPKEVCGCTKHHVRFKRDDYEQHRHHAAELNERTIVTEKVIKESPLLTKVQDGKGFRIDHHKLTHSEPYLNRQAFKVLREMGEVFSKKVKDTEAEGSTFHISSLTRTIEQQEKLRKSPSGRNASPNVSAHSYGASFDIYKLDNTNSCTQARKAFEEMLVEFQKAGRILLCPEGNCIHVTVRK
jgi:hypothetical protein